MKYGLDPIAQGARDFMLNICRRHKLTFADSMGIPLLAEGERIAGMWASLETALAQSSERQLIIAFINERASETAEARASNLQTLDFFSVPHDFPFSLNPLGKDFLLVVNGTLPEFKLGESEGVGRARKVPADLAWGLWQDGILTSEFHRQSDADVRLPADYFLTQLKSEEVAATYAYHHTQGELNSEEFAALQHYERWLASYCEGLEFAGSPYCYWALGSTLFFRLSAYGHIRGFPNVRAGEDFHFLSKLRKHGRIARLAQPSLEIRGRHSTRVPFGTGRALENMRAEKKAYALYPPQVFVELKEVLQQLNHLAEHKNLEKFLSAVDERSQIFFEAHRKVFTNILAQGSSTEQKRKLLHESFDALATLRWINQRIT